MLHESCKEGSENLCAIHCPHSLSLFKDACWEQEVEGCKTEVRRRWTHYSIFMKHVARPLSPNTSDYCPSISDDHADESPSDVDSSDGRGGDNQARMSVVALQRLYSVFLPPHLRLNQDHDTRGKRRKIKNRPPIYTGDSRTTAWRKDVAQRKAAQGCGTLDGFIKRMVSKPKDPQSEASHHQ